MTMTTLPPLALKALRYVEERRVQIVSVSRPRDVLYCDALVYGSSEHPYSVAKFGAQPWHCTCPARVNPCAHIVAVALVCPLEIGRVE